MSCTAFYENGGNESNYSTSRFFVSGEKLVKKLKELEEDLNNQECARVGSAHWLPPTRHSMQDISTVTSTSVASVKPTLDHTQSMPNLEVSAEHRFEISPNIR